MDFLTKNDTHKTWHKFSNWITKTFGSDLYGEWKYINISSDRNKVLNAKYRSLDEEALSKRLVGYDVMCKVEKYVKRYCPEIKIVQCHDTLHSGSIILLVPHPAHGITVMYIPQCTGIQNQFFLYNSHFEALMKAFNEMKSVYENCDE